MIHYMRWETVTKLHDGGASWLRAYEQAREQLAGTAAAGEEATMAASYKKVAGDLRNGRTARYDTAMGNPYGRLKPG